MTSLNQNETSSSNSKRLLSMDGIHLRYPNTTQATLQNINLELQQKEILTVIGPNGAGKTSLIKILVGLVRPTSGIIRHHIKTRIGYMPQKLSADRYLPMKVARFLKLVQASKVSRDEALELLQITHLRANQLGELSGGEFQRVLLARALLRKPNLLVLDEPLQGVDVNGQIELYRLIAQLREELNCAVVMVSHDLHLVMAQSDTVVCLNQHICCDGHPESISQHPEYLRLFGSEAARDLAIYHHEHDHHHNLHGDVVVCDEQCSHD